VTILVIPAKAGIQWFQEFFWMPAFAGMATKKLNQAFSKRPAQP
jgi:hypothetical protein